MNGSGPWAELHPWPYSWPTLGLLQAHPWLGLRLTQHGSAVCLRDWNLGGLACFPMNSYLRATLWIFELLSEGSSDRFWLAFSSLSQVWV